MIKYILFSVLLCYVNADADLPKYIKPCKADPATLNDCALKSAREAFTEILKGDKTLKVPKLTPLVLPFVEGFSRGDKLKFTFHNLTVTGLQNLDIKEVKTDLKNKELHVLSHSPFLTFAGPYTLEGQILILPIRGNGNGNVTLMDSDYIFNLEWTEIEKGGKKFMKISKSRILFDPKTTFFEFTGLFNGDKKLGDHVNVFLNENNKDVLEELKPAITNIMEPIVTNHYKAYMEPFPLEQLFPH